MRTSFAQCFLRRGAAITLCILSATAATFSFQTAALRLCSSESVRAWRASGLTEQGGAGALLCTAAKAAVAEGLAGLEWAAGIPGTVGGAVAMNAGAYGGEIKQVLKSVTVVECGRIAKKIVHAGDLGYRSSVYAFPNAVVAGAADGEARRRMEEINMRRKEKQPLEYPSAGSTFKRPEGHFAGALIEQAGLKGTRIGGAEVSPKHAGFIVNCGGATCADVLNLIDLVRERVYKEFGVLLEPEIKIIK